MKEFLINYRQSNKKIMNEKEKLIFFYKIPESRYIYIKNDDEKNFYFINNPVFL